MFIHCELAILILALTLDVYTLIGGHEAVPHSRPYMAILERTEKDVFRVVCAGFLLSEDFVMTGAPCNPKRVLLGVHNYYNSTGIQRIEVKQAFRHEDYDEEGWKNDIMLLKLKSKVKFTENVKPIGFASDDNCCLPASCTVAGWGVTSKGPNGHISDVLMEADVTLTDNEQCPDEKLYCSEGGSGPHTADAGAPLVCEDGKAYGVVSAGNDQINFYTKIPAYVSWINSIMKR